MRKYLTGIFAVLLSQMLLAQQPLGIKYKLSPLGAANTYTVSGLKSSLLDEADNAPRNGSGQALRAGRLINVSFTPQNTGSWEAVKGGRLWRKKVQLDDAKGVTVLGKMYNLPQGGHLNIYRPDGSEAEYYSAQNFQHQPIISSKIIGGSEAIIEYFEPAGQEGKGSFVIEKLGYIYNYRDPQEITAASFGNAGNCQVNINCAEGANWQHHKRSITLITCYTDDIIQYCTGTLMNTTQQSFKPYILTAMHCGENFSGKMSNDTLFAYWTFMFNYESLTCNNPATDSGLRNHIITGSQLVAHSDDKGGDLGSDFMLVELSQKVPLKFGAYYAGWSLDTLDNLDSGVSIHHPKWDIKKISTHVWPLNRLRPTQTSPGKTHWEVLWAATLNGTGVTEGGSSGSPMFSKDGYVIGTLTGGNSSCSAPGQTDIYGRMDWHWTKNGTTPERRLKNWLDSANTGKQKQDGVYEYPVGIKEINNQQQIQLYPNPAADWLNIKVSNLNALNTIIVTNLLGEQVITLPVTVDGWINIGGLPAGIYLVTVEENNTVYKGKFIKQ